MTALYDMPEVNQCINCGVLFRGAPYETLCSDKCANEFHEEKERNKPAKENSKRFHAACIIFPAIFNHADEEASYKLMVEKTYKIVDELIKQENESI